MVSASRRPTSNTRLGLRLQIDLRIHDLYVHMCRTLCIKVYMYTHVHMHAGICAHVSGYTCIVAKETQTPGRIFAAI